MMEPVTKNKEIITTCPICKQEIRIGQLVFYHPGDERYKGLEGKRAKVPLFDFEVPIMIDERADPEKGTGLVMCCTFGDSTDMEWLRRLTCQLKRLLLEMAR